jgi:uncharacterized membrane protein
MALPAIFDLTKKRKMSSSLEIVRFLSLVVLMLVTGVFWGTWFSLSRSIEKFPAESFLAIGRVMIANLAWPMRILMPLTILLMLAGLLLSPAAGAAFYLALLAFVLIIAALLVTLLVEVPIDNRIRTWTVSSLPADWKALRGRWEVYHTVRTFCSLASFVALLLSALLS